MATDADDEALPPNHKEFPDGSLLRVVFHNFLTYDHTSFIPTANLNMILGHNGSGKSSIICGICLACGGSPKSLGRSEKITDYIKHGCQEGYVEVAIADQAKGPQIVRLTIRIGKAPEYMLNEAHATQNDIAQLRKRYNIQIDNPCAFLAQDKVKSFSEQSSVELLKNTEKAASDDLDQQHKALMDQRKDSTTIEELCATTEKAKKHLEDNKTKIMPLVENYRKKIALQSKLRLLEKKKACLVFEEAEKEYDQERKNVDEKLVEYRKVEAKIKECEDKSKIHEKTIKRERDKMLYLLSAQSDIVSSITSKSDKKFAEDMVKNAAKKVAIVKQKAETHKHDVELCQASIEAAEKKLKEATDDFSGYKDFQVEQEQVINQCSKEERECNADENALYEKTRNRRAIENKLKTERDAVNYDNSKRFRALEGLSSDAGAAWQWYKSNRDQFKGNVYSPMLHMVLKTKEAAKVLENCIGMRDRSMFVCQYKEDELLLNGKNQKWRINTAVVFPDSIYPDEINAQLPEGAKRLGFEYMATSCFDAPDVLKQYLINVAGLNRIPIGKIDERNIESINNELDRLRIGVYMANNMRFQLSKSRYANQSINSQSMMRDAYSWVDSCFMRPWEAKKENPALLQEYKDLGVEIQNEEARIKAKRQEITAKRSVLRQDELDWKAKKSVQTQWKVTLQTEQAKLENLQKENHDVKKAEKEEEDVLLMIAKKVKDRIEENKKAHDDYLNLSKKIGNCSFMEITAKARSTRLREKANEHRSSLNDLKEDKDAAEDQLKTALQRKKTARSALKSECELNHLDVTKMEPEDKTLYETMMKLFEDSKVPTELDEVERSITSEKTRLALVQDSGADGSIEHEHELQRINNDLEAETAKYEKLVQNRQNAHDELGNQIGKWREEVEEMIEKINENYIKFFEVLGCRGEVSLEIPENPLDIEKYGIMIMVSFRRGENMKRLDNKVQSGGERSVATMLYLLALQQLCPVPFRCIDEINQGMDPTNERKVFDIMVGLWNGTSGKLTKTQYFLLSPKLLHGLDMRDNVNVVMVNSTLTTAHGDRYDTMSKIRKTFASLGIQH